MNDLKKAGALLDPADADHPPGRVRRARCGRDPAPAGVDGGARDLRPRRADQPSPADVRGSRRDHPPDRARRRSRLHDVLFEAGARGARRGSERRGRARGRGRDVRPVGSRSPGCTVLVAMAGMFLTGDPGFASFGVATMTVVAVAMLGSLTVLPALLSKLGDNVDRARVPFVHRLRRDDGGGRFWGAIIDRVLRHPAISVGLGRRAARGARGAGATSCTPLSRASTRIPQNLLDDLQPAQGGLPGDRVGANVVVKAPNVEAPAVQEAIGQLKWRAIDSGVMNEPIDVDVNAAKTVANINIPVEGDGTDATSNQALDGAPRRDHPADGGHARRRRGRRHRNDGAGQGLQRSDEGRRRRSCSASCCCSRSA